MRLVPCVDCRHRSGCEIRLGVRAALSALPAPTAVKRGSVAWRCPERDRGLEPGVVCEVEWRQTIAGEWGQGEACVETARVVVMTQQRSGLRAVCWILDPEEWRWAERDGYALRALPGRRVVAFKHSALRPTEQRVELCASCRRPLSAPEPEQREAGRDVCDAYRCTGAHRPAGWSTVGLPEPERAAIASWQRDAFRVRQPGGVFTPSFEEWPRFWADEPEAVGGLAWCAD